MHRINVRILGSGSGSGFVLHHFRHLSFSAFPGVSRRRAEGTTDEGNNQQRQFYE